MLSMTASMILVLLAAMEQAERDAARTAQAQAQTQTAPAPPATEVYLVSMADPASWSAESVTNISASPGYDNQPSFMRDSRSVLFASNRDGKQTDIYRYWIADKKLTAVTETPESEYSPTVTPDGGGVSVIQVEADGTQRLWQFDLAGRSPHVVLADVQPVGYHAWVNGSAVMVFVLGDPPTLQRAAPGSALTETIATGIGRSLVAIPGTAAVSYTARDEEGRWWVHRYDADTRTSRPLVQAPPGGGEPHTTWSRDGRLFTAAGTRIFSWKEGDPEWRLVGDLSAAPLTGITRLAISPDGRWLALVAEPKG